MANHPLMPPSEEQCSTLVLPSRTGSAHLEVSIGPYYLGEDPLDLTLRMLNVDRTILNLVSFEIEAEWVSGSSAPVSGVVVVESPLKGIVVVDVPKPASVGASIGSVFYMQSGVKVELANIIVSTISPPTSL